MSRAFVAALALVGCNASLEVDPTGHRCSDLEPCGPGFVCVDSACRVASGVGGGSAGGTSLVGGGAAGGASTTGGGASGGGSCVDSACTTPPVGECDGSTARSFSPQGRCQANQCVYDAFELDCAPGTCSAGTCPLTVSQVGPRVRFRISAVDVAPGSAGASVLVAGPRSQVSHWDGTSWATIAPPAANVGVRAVNFTSQQLAWVVGDNRAVWRFDRATRAFLSTPAPSGLSPSATLIGVDGVSDTLVLVADTVGGYAKWNGTAWTTGSLPTSTASGFSISSVWVDENQRERIAGSCFNATSQRRTCVAYRNPLSTTNPTTWFVDTDETDARGCVSLGPWVEVPLAGGQEALCGYDDNGSRRHSTLGTFSSMTVALTTGTGVVGITGGPPSAGARAVWVLTSSILGQGRLSRLGGLPPMVTMTTQLDTFLGEEHLSPSESGGVVVTETNAATGANSIFYRRTAPAERTEALDLGLDFGAVTSLNGMLALVSTNGDLAVKLPGSETFEFRRPPTQSPQYRVEDADGRNGTQSLLVVGRDGANAGLISRISFAGYTRLTTTAPSTTFRAVCRASDSEAWAVGTGGAVFSIGASSATREPTVTTVNELNDVDCPAVGQAIACGAGSTVLRRLPSGVWEPVPFPMPGLTFTSCQLVNGSIWVAGDGLFARYDTTTRAWTHLPAQPGLANLVVRAPNDVFATSAGATSFDVVRFDGASWTTALAGLAGRPAKGAAVGNRVVWGGAAGVLVEGR